MYVRDQNMRFQSRREYDAGPLPDVRKIFRFTLTIILSSTYRYK